MLLPSPAELLAGGSSAPSFLQAPAKEVELAVIDVEAAEQQAQARIAKVQAQEAAAEATAALAHATNERNR